MVCQRPQALLDEALARAFDGSASHGERLGNGAVLPACGRFEQDAGARHLARRVCPTVEQMFQVSRVVSRPVAMFVDHSDETMIRAAVEAGVSAYIVDGLRKERVKAIVDMAISRFEAFGRLPGIGCRA